MSNFNQRRILNDKECIGDSYESRDILFGTQGVIRLN